MPTSPQIAKPLYSAEDHKTWARLFARQKAVVEKHACKDFLVGSKKLALDPERLPEMSKVSARVKKMTGWKLSNCGNKSVSIKDWFDAMSKGIFPVTDYIRPAEHFDYTAKPDLFHEYFGHLPFLTNKKFAAMAKKFGVMCARADNRQMLQISRIWSLGVEFGVIKEKGEIKLLGAGLLSSHGECLHAIETIKKGRIVPFELKNVINTTGKTYEFHKKYFLMNSVDDIYTMLIAYGKKEGLIR